MEWTECLKGAVKFIEAHLLEEIEVKDVAAAVYMSPFYFQKGFSIMTGYSVGEYIRQRRLYLAALDVLAGQEKGIDLAYKYGYAGELYQSIQQISRSAAYAAQGQCRENEGVSSSENHSDHTRRRQHGLHG